MVVQVVVALQIGHFGLVGDFGAYGLLVQALVGHWTALAAGEELGTEVDIGVRVGSERATAREEIKQSCSEHIRSFVLENRKSRVLKRQRETLCLHTDVGVLVQ